MAIEVSKGFLKACSLKVISLVLGKWRRGGHIARNKSCGWGGNELISCLWGMSSLLHDPERGKQLYKCATT